MFDFNKFKVKSGSTLKKINYNALIDSSFIKKLRSNLNMTQRTFAAAIGVSVKSIEKWETSNCNINGATKRLLYLLSERPDFVNVIYPIEEYRSNEKIKKTFEFKSSVSSNKQSEKVKYTVMDSSVLYTASNSPYVEILHN